MRWKYFAQACPSASVWVLSSRGRQHDLLTSPFTVFSSSVSQVVKRTCKANTLLFGTGDFAILTLTRLRNRKDLSTIEAVTTSRQRECERPESTVETPVKHICLNNLKLHVIGCNSDPFTLARGKLAFDIPILVSVGFFLPYELLKGFLFDTINSHTSELSSYRGAARIDRGDEKQVGGSFITVGPAGFDTGDMYIQNMPGVDLHEVRDSVAERSAYVGSSMVDIFFCYRRWNHMLPDILLYNGDKKIPQDLLINVGKSKARKPLKSGGAMVAWTKIQNQFFQGAETNHRRAYSTSLCPNDNSPENSDRKVLGDIISSIETKMVDIMSSSGTTFAKQRRRQKIGVALSGGTDSTALLFLLKTLFKMLKGSSCNLSEMLECNRIFAIIVDHGLRNGSTSEARYIHSVYESCTTVETLIVTLNSFEEYDIGKIIGSSNCIQEWARCARYSKIYDTCKLNEIDLLITGHHFGDQIETYLLRMFRCSGNNGLRAIDAITAWNHDLPIIRPLLNYEKKTLENICEEESLRFIRDPSNDNKDFDRVRIREALKSTQKIANSNIIGSSCDITVCIENSVNDLISLMAIRKAYVDNIITSGITDTSVVFNPKLRYASLNLKFSNSADYDIKVQEKILKAIIQTLSQNKYPPSDKLCGIATREICQSRTDLYKKERLWYTNIQNCVVQVKYKSHSEVGMMLRKSPASYKKHLEFLNRENGIVVDNEKLITLLSAVEETTDAELKLFWDCGFAIYLSQCRSRLRVEYDRETVLVYQIPSCRCSSACDQCDTTAEYGIGPLPRDLIIKPKPKRFHSMAERQNFTFSSCNLKAQSALPKNFFKSCFGLYRTTRKLCRNKHWKLVGIPQIHVLFS